jgi:hypothetical protein
VFGGLIFSPRMITLAVALRDLRRWSERRRQRSNAATVPSN